jgi:hypothetical protein
MLRLIALIVLASTVVNSATAQAQAEPKKPRYVRISLCQISFKIERSNPRLISVDAEFVNAFPHGLFLTDQRCKRDGLQIDFPDAGLDPSVAFIQNHLLQIHRASGTFRGILKRDYATGLLFLWLQSVGNFQTSDALTFDLPPPYIDEPIRLPEPPPLNWPKSP